MNPRLLTLEDVPAALELSKAAGWNQTAADWQRIIELEPHGCFGFDCDERLVATATLLCFGASLAWIGMVLTHRDYMRRGFARGLMTAALDEAKGRGVKTVKLDATGQGRPLYESVGFIAEQPVERWSSPAGVVITAADGCADDVPWTLDAEAFGADRSRFIRALGSPVLACDTGYAIERPGARASYFGPFVTRDPARFRLQPAEADIPCFWDLLPNNEPARALASRLGFQPVRHLVRMRFGPPLQTRDDLVFAIAGFEAG